MLLTFLDEILSIFLEFVGKEISWQFDRISEFSYDRTLCQRIVRVTSLNIA